MDILLLPLMLIGWLFIMFPYAAAIPALLFGWFFWKTKSLVCLLTALLWLAYGVYEYLMYIRVLCTGECNIRIDLILIYPILVVVSIIAGVVFYRQLKRG